MLIPQVPMGPPAATYIRQINRLEIGLEVALETLQLMVDRLETKFGDDLFSEKTKSVAVLQSEKAAAETIDRFEQLIKQGQQSTVLREIRAEFALTWDEAQAMVTEWSSLSREQKVRQLRLTRWMTKTGLIKPKT